MNNLNTLKIKLNEASLILASHPSWAKAIHACAFSLDQEPKETVRKILSMYSGMGSFNDIVLYKNGQPLQSENLELDCLRQEIHKLCIELL
jgi:hypothetical protein